MKTRYTASILPIFLLYCIALHGCGLKEDKEPSKGEIIISDELKDGNNTEDNPGKDNINIIRLQDEDGNTGENTDFKEIYSDGEITSFPSGVVITGNSAYEQYTYVDGIALKYTDTINNIADSLKGMSDVYSIVIPTSIGITFPDNKKNMEGSSSQKKALKKIASKMSGNVQVCTIIQYHDEPQERIYLLQD